jgi:uncharacterized protein (TIGR02679 family)
VNRGPTPTSTPGVDLARLARVLGTPDTAWLVERVRKRAARGRPLTGSLTLNPASPAQRRAVDTLLGRAPSRGTSLSLRLEELDALLRTAGIHSGGLRAAIEELTGPIPDARANAAAEAQAWQHAYEPLDAAVSRIPCLGAWWSSPHSRGTVKRLAGADPTAARALSTQAASVLAALPADGIPLPVLAARTTGDAHALDADQPAGRLVLAVTEQWAIELSSDPETLISLPRSERRRAQWAELGVGLDELSSRVLVLGLPGNPAGSNGLGPLLAVAKQYGEPLALTLRQIRQAVDTAVDSGSDPGPDPFGAVEGEVFLCENPAVLESAATRLGPACPPLICVEGHLSVAARALLRALSERGAHLRYHGDFDWGGVRIANSVFTLTDATAWRYSHSDYLEAVESGHGTPLNTGEPCDASWDPDLRAAITRSSTRVEEEHVLPDLLADLSAHAGH